MKKIVLLLLVFVFFVSFIFTAPLLPEEKELLKKIEQLYQQEDCAKALEVIDKSLSGFSEPDKLLAVKSNILSKIKQWEESLKKAVKRAEAMNPESGMRSMFYIIIGSICLKLNDTEQAFKWLNKAVDQGFLSYGRLYHDKFKLLHKDKRFDQLVEKIKSHIGIGKPAKDFTIELITGEKFTLSKQKGKVILVDFWATWCKPCVEEIHHLKEFYLQYKAKGFEIIGISLDFNKKVVEDYIAKENIKWKIACSGDVKKDATARYYNVKLIPSYWLIDRNGILRDFGRHLSKKETINKAMTGNFQHVGVLPQVEHKKK
jgi:peroxiredoxin